MVSSGFTLFFFGRPRARLLGLMDGGISLLLNYFLLRVSSDQYEIAIQ